MASHSRAGFLVIGAGLNGLSTAWQLGVLGARDVVLLEQFTLGHHRGSSHGHSRISRSTYPNPVYVRLHRAALRDAWPRLEQDSGRRLLIPCPGCFMGTPGGIYEGFRDTMRGFEDEVTILGPREAARRFPQFRFDGLAGAILDRSAAVIAAADTVDALAALCRRQGATVRENTPVTAIDLSRDPIRVECGEETWSAERVVVAAGPWTARLLPGLGSRLTPVRQSVGFFRLDGRGGSVGPDGFPVWGYLGADAHDFYYGLPEFGREGVKAARHAVSDAPDDPDLDPGPSPESLEELRRFVDRVFTARVEAMVHAETCFYTSTASEDFILDLHPGNPNLVIGAGFSGHGFKFGPLTGRILAELALRGRSEVPEFDDHRGSFSLERPGS